MPCSGGPSDSAADIQARRDEQALFHSAATPLLCEACAEMARHDMMRFRSPALQAFWARHQEDDRQRLAQELPAEQTEAARQAALAKLTPHERKLLNLP